MKAGALLPLILLSIGTSTAMAKGTVADVLREAPSRSMFMVDSLTVLDMFDYYAAGDARPSQSLTADPVRITAADSMSVSLSLGNYTTYQVALLPARDSLVMVIETISSSIPDSKVSFYDTTWQPAKGKLFSEPLLSDWLTPLGRKNRKFVEDKLPCLFVSYAYDPATTTLTLTNNTAAYFTEEDYASLAPMLRESLNLRWNGKTFTPVTTDK